MKKQLYILMAFLVAASMVLAACGATPTAAPATAAPATAAPTTAAPATAAPATAAPATAAATTAAGAPMKLSIICRCVVGGSSSNEANWILNYVIPGFVAQMKTQGKNVTVDLVQFGGSDEELQARYALDLKGGTGSDLMDFDGFWTPQFASGGLIKPLSAIVGPTWKDWEGWTHISSGIQQLLSYQGQVYGIPTGTDARVIWYRKDLFKKAGLPDNWQPKSWADLIAAANQLKKALPGVIPLQLDAGESMGEATTMQGWYMVFLGTGNNVYDYQTNKFPDTGQAFLDALNLYKTIYVDNNLGDARTQLLTDGRDMSFLSFGAGKTAMLVEGDWFWRAVIGPGGEAYMKDRDTLVGWAKMPAEAPGKGINGQDYVTVSGGTGFIMNPNTKDPADAWALMTFMYSKAARDNFETIQPGLSSRDDVAVPNDATLTAIAQAMLPLTTVRPSDPAYSEFVSPALQLMTERVVSGEMTPQQALAAFTAEQTADVGASKLEATTK